MPFFVHFIIATDRLKPLIKARMGTS